jgi:hypothetical protein
MLITTKVQKIFKNFNWDAFYNFVPELQNKLFNEPQGRFIKSLLAELSIEKFSNKTLIRVGEIRCDFITNGSLKREKINTVELKTMTTFTMYCRKGLRNSYSIKLDNSNGDNMNRVIAPKNYADILLVVYSDGAFIYDLKLMKNHITSKGDGNTLKIPNDCIIEVGKNKNLNQKSTNWVSDEFENFITKIIEKA